MLLEHLYNALMSPLGIKLECDDVLTLRTRLYVERRAAEDPQLACLSFIPSPLNPRHLWLVKRTEPTDE